jgi:L-asparagine transporter-like permease
MMFSLAGREDAPKALGRIGRTGVPAAAVLVSTVVGFITVIFNYVSPDTVFLFLTNSSGAIAVFVWLVIAVSQLRMRRRLERDDPARLTLRMWGYPYLTWVSIGAMVVLLAGMAFDADARSQLLLSLLVGALVLVVGLVRHRVRVRGAVGSAEAS